MSGGRLLRTLGWLALVTAALSGLTLVLWWWGMDPHLPGDRVGALNAALAPWRTPLQAVRVIGWCLAGRYWPAIGRRWLNLDGSHLGQWQRLRFTVIGGLLGLEAAIALGRLSGGL